MSTPPPLGMSAPPPPPPPPPSSSRRGCFIAIGVVFVLLLLLCLGSCLVVSRNPAGFTAWSMGLGRTGFVQKLAADVPADQRTAFESEYDAYVAYLKGTTPESFKTQGQALLGPFQYLQGAMGDGSITTDEVQRFVEMSRQLRGASAPAPQPQATAPAEPAPLPPEGTAPEGATAPIEGAPDDGGTPVEGTAPAGATPPAPGTP